MSEKSSAILFLESALSDIIMDLGYSIVLFSIVICSVLVIILSKDPLVFKKMVGGKTILHRWNRIISQKINDADCSSLIQGSVGVRLNGTVILFHLNELTLSCPFITFYKWISPVIDISQITDGNIDCIGNPDIRVIVAV